ncbi:MAG: glutamate racemase [Candidatus Saccharibacteria bacterium]
MKIGVFDSGLGGLLTLKHLRQSLPQYDYVYFGDTLHMPYGSKTAEEVFALTRGAVESLFDLDCGLVIVACNTASSEALRRVQQEVLPGRFPDRRVLGVIRPIAESAYLARRIGVLATEGTVNSEAYLREILKVNPEAFIVQQAAPSLVPLLEAGKKADAAKDLPKYLAPLREAAIDTLVLGCTHYPLLKEQFKELMPEVSLIDQTGILPDKLADYLSRHPEIEGRLDKNGVTRLILTKRSQELEAKGR